ncbi:MULTISPECIES: isochorismatase family protein [Pantoea]|jgi:nicotinamidase-related amidase|uniref:Isochorismatase family protein n=1 Tax=Pantoea brenneri TaxID=472694 RepID=A0A7Y6NBW5_9GAMM|nr:MULTISPECIES: isochorismatase family protein [Pantoea]KKD34066.1 isochorismatase [Pantoea sp. 3.5.1]MBZ6393835.1 isochorismatase family protein [Pantoea sp.]MBZ6436787.1 isochorismatase family protein [Pantoea sp.]MCQ5472377.1 isochorismatase family protein [Pantoea brenneri]MDH1085260.1 isochorismatase family protein [Pantoea brenneri]
MKNALIVIDIQNDYFPGGAFPLEAADEACKAAVKAINDAQQKGWLIVGVQHIATAEAPFFRPESEGAAFHPDIAAALGNAPVVVKAEADSFFNTNLEPLLSEHGITDIYLTGMMTQHCVTHTALSPQSQPMKVHIIAAGCAAPTRALSDLALSGLRVRCSVEQAILN